MPVSLPRVCAARGQGPPGSFPLQGPLELLSERALHGEASTHHQNGNRTNLPRIWSRTWTPDCTMFGILSRYSIRHSNILHNLPTLMETRLLETSFIYRHFLGPTSARKGGSPGRGAAEGARGTAERRPELGGQETLAVARDAAGWKGPRGLSWEQILVSPYRQQGSTEGLKPKSDGMRWG